MIRLLAVCVSMRFKIGIVGTRGKGRNHKSLALTGEASHKQAVHDATAQRGVPAWGLYLIAWRGWRRHQQLPLRIWR